VPSYALGDFEVRKSEFDSLLTLAAESLDPQSATMHSKCAIVLACAAFERYMNDVLEEACSNFDETSWKDLSPGRQRYLLRHMALAMSERAGSFTGKTQIDESDCDKLTKFVRACDETLDDPSTWQYFSDFGLFGEGTKAPDKIDSVLRAFDSDGRSLYAYIKDSGVDLSSLIPGLQQLVDARHGAAHALKEFTPPGPSDAAEWVDCAVTMAQKVDSFLEF